MKQTILSGKNISKIFEKNKVKNQVFDKLTVEIYEGDFTVIMGASGSGKSTLLYALSGMDNITDGQVFYKGKEISKYSEKQMAALRIKEFGFVFQQIHLISNLTLYENAVVAGYLDSEKTEKEINERAEKLLKQMHLSEAKNRLPSEVSGGEAQRAAIVRAVMNHPILLFADELTGALNKKNSEDVLNLLTQLHKNGQSILMVTHDLRAAIHGNRLLYLEDGKILDELSLSAFSKEEIKKRESTVNAWLDGLKW